ncbi:MAG: Kdo hydroxylase family protein [Burkholderiaceae bacterium]
MAQSHFPFPNPHDANGNAPIGEQIMVIEQTTWNAGMLHPEAIAALEGGKVLYFPKLPFTLEADETQLLNPAVRNPNVRNISFSGVGGSLKGAVGGIATLTALEKMIGRYREQARTLIVGMLPQYSNVLRMAPTSYRPARVESRPQSWRADDRRLHIDAFPSRPNRGERILRVFSNVNPNGVPRVWRVGEPFEVVAQHFFPRLKRYAKWQARCLQALRITKSLRTEYDHLMLQLHDSMKSDLNYQQDAHQTTIAFLPGTTWICYSDQTSHAVMSGQYMLEQTLHLPPQSQYDRGASPLAILSRMCERPLA